MGTWLQIKVTEPGPQRHQYDTVGGFFLSYIQEGTKSNKEG